MVTEPTAEDLARDPVQDLEYFRRHCHRSDGLGHISGLAEAWLRRALWAEQQLAQATDHAEQLEAEAVRLQARVDALEKENARQWEADHQYMHLQEKGLAEEFGIYGCDAIQFVADALLGARAEAVRLQGLVDSLAARVAVQSELLSKRAEGQP